MDNFHERHATGASGACRCYAVPDDLSKTMSPPLEVMAELFRQLAFISALIGGFSLAFLVQLLTAHLGRRVAGWTIGFSMAATAGLIVCTLGWTLSAVVVTDPAPQAEAMRLSGALTHLNMRLTDGFVVSLLLFLVSLGLCGWVRSRVMGVVSSTIALAAAAFMFLILRLFIR